MAGSQHSTIGGKRERSDCPLPTIPAANELARGRIPELDGLSLVCVVATGREGQCADRQHRRELHRAQQTATVRPRGAR